MVFIEEIKKVLQPYEDNIYQGATKSFNIINVLDLITEIKTDTIEDMDVLDHMTDIDSSVHEWCYTGPMSSSYLNATTGGLNFVLNGEPLSDMDVEVKIIRTYFYIYSKVQLNIISLIVINGSETVLIKGSTTDIVDPTASEDEINIKVNEYFGVIYDNTEGIELTIKKKNIPLRNDGVMKNVLFDTTKIIKDILLIDSTGIKLDVENYVITKPFYIELLSTVPPDVICYVFYETNNCKSDNPNVENYYLEKLFDNLTEAEMKVLDISYSDVMVEEKYFETEDILMDYLIQFRYDIYMYAMKINHNNGMVFHDSLSSKFDIHTETATYSPLSKTLRYDDTPFYITLHFRNFYNNLYEIYIDRKLYQGYYIYDYTDWYVTIYLKPGDLKAYTDDYENSVFEVILKPKTYKRMSYLPPTEDYNGVAFLSREYEELDHMEVYDNGINIFYYDDFETNYIFPNKFLAILPRLRVGWHRICITGYTKTFDRYEYRKSTSDIVNNILEVKYIDFRFTIRHGNYTLIPFIDYEILSPTKIYIKNIIKYPNTSEFYILYEGLLEVIFLDNINKSLRKRLFDNDLLTTNYYKNMENTPYNELDIKPERYVDDVYYKHMMITKYYNSELLYSMNDTSIYGDEWNDSLLAEFPFLIENKYVQLSYNKEYPIEEMPRRIILPAPLPLNVMMIEHEAAINRLKFEQAFISEYHGTIDTSKRYNIEQPNEYKIINRFANRAFSTIPINFIKK